MKVAPGASSWKDDSGGVIYPEGSPRIRFALFVESHAGGRLFSKLVNECVSVLFFFLQYSRLASSY
jgi:hypothetical protein